MPGKHHFVKHPFSAAHKLFEFVGRTHIDSGRKTGSSFDEFGKAYCHIFHAVIIIVLQKTDDENLIH
ncbi:hypothetical protein GCM10007901_04550 [Dyella acidisoli]|uniref:DUF4372 domain-containing protein n=1 Tax=Dyella acidisoli TaxID=1867834 RepID=A0ABQ5XIH3_9GAMM|nr:hypothetical protein GCM10007901_04550 [Dyella acidisoli]